MALSICSFRYQVFFLVDEPTALKVKTESHIEVFCNDHDMSLEVVCVDEDGDVVDKGYKVALRP